MLKPYLEAGEIVTTHGVLGEVKVLPWCDGPAFLAGFDTLYFSEGSSPCKVERARPHKNICIIKLAGVNDMETARRLVGRTLWMARADVTLPEGRFFVQDMLGAEVKDADTGHIYGRIANITRPGRHDVYEIELPGGGTALFPAAAEFVESIDVKNAVVTVRPITGMFPEEDAAAGGDAP